MEDFLGQPIQENDRVISHYGYGQSGLTWGTVISLTPKMVKVKFEGLSGYKTRYPTDLVVMGEEQLQSLAMSRLSGRK
jgi:hypothetical protein